MTEMKHLLPHQNFNMAKDSIVRIKDANQLVGGETLSILTTIFENTPVLMSFLDTNFNYVMVSRSMAEYFGFSPAEMMGLSPFREQPEAEQKFGPIMQQVLETNQPASGKEYASPYPSPRFPDHPESYWNYNFTPIFDESGQNSGLFWIMEDVTRQVLHRQGLEQSANRHKERTVQLETIVSSLSEGLVVIDTEGTIIIANQMVDQILGRKMLGQNPYRDGPKVFNRRHLDGTPMRREDTMSGRVLNGETFQDFRYLLKDGTGRERVVSSNGTPLYDETEKLSGGVLLFRDVTEQERQQQELEETSRATEEAQVALLEMANAAAGIADLPQLLNRIVEIMPQVTGCDRVGIMLYDAQTELSTPGAVYGISDEEKLQWMQAPPTPRDHNSPYDAIFFEEQRWLVIDMEALQAEARKKGEEIPNPFGVKTLFAAPLVYKSEIIGILTLDHLGDRHEFVPREIRVLEGMGRLAAIAIQNVRLLVEANQATTLREANRLKDEFLSLVAHELRNPLTAVQGYTQMTQRRLRKAGIPETDLKPLETIIAQAQRMTRLVDDLLDLSRIETGHLELRHEETDLAELVKRQVETYLTDTTNHQIPLELVNGPDHALYTGSYDATRLDQVTSNLISNAMKYSPDGGAINIRLERKKLSALEPTTSEPAAEVLHFSIQDQGIGIPLEQQADLFERFYRANNSRDSGLPGLGLGLYISSQIITLLGGRMWAESAGEGQGSTFHFTLPVN